MERFVPVGAGRADPVAEAVGVGRVVVSDDGVRLPAHGFLMLGVSLENDADGEEVVDFLEGRVLFFDFVPNRVDRLGAAFDGVAQVGDLQVALDGADEPGNEAVAGGFGGAEFGGDFAITRWFGEFEVQILQFGFNRVQPQPVGERGVEVGRFGGNF